MPCKVIDLPGGGRAILKLQAPRKRFCVTCGKPAPVLCDYPVKRAGKETTCDRACCRAHCVSIGPDRDYCLAHAEGSGINGPLFAGKEG